MKKFLLVFGLFQSMSWGCSCLARSLKDQFLGTDVVFIGTVKSVERIGPPVHGSLGTFQQTIATLVIDAGLKSEFNTQLIRVHGYQYGVMNAACGGSPHFAKGEQWLVFADWGPANYFFRKAPDSGVVLSSGPCSKTVNLTGDHNNPVINELDRILKDQVIDDVENLLGPGHDLSVPKK